MNNHVHRWQFVSLTVGGKAESFMDAFGKDKEGKARFICDCGKTKSVKPEEVEQ